jgi:hypothetical protein
VNLNEIEQAFTAELQKIGSSNMRVAQSRIGRRPISAETLLKKDAKGTLFKHTPPSAPTEEKEG